ncbi:efflux RND transporter periplasmic adaptor subunit [Roseibacillus persicicus]|uniref:efflux RND transporter periplasmic adaptor subunit n=1 Tax=Roseibacillus persicicus TaxID=454148 RepID=UPI00280CEE34|nr:efflux RND transporter periplasmic adaptor subunit [Roseibacillus persicicus]MDQ8190241.1 efflux RND transporter periplasmic adaptor subunit [Roseibacillus persicicus]
MSSLKKVLSKLLGIFRKTGSIVFPLLILLVFLAGWWIGRPPAKSTTGADAPASDSGTIWTCSMHPTVRQPGPGLCPICEMDLIEVSAESSGGLRELKLTADAIARLDIRVAPVVREAATKSLKLLGKITSNETSLTTTTARIDGRLDKLLIDFTGATVLKGQPIAEIYSPDLLVAQQELISARRELDRNSDRTRQVLYRAAREKLRLLELTPEQIDEIETKTQPSDRITLRAPFDGVVMDLKKREGEYVKTGEALYTLMDLSSVWVQLEVFENDLPWLALDQTVELRTNALPGEVFSGQVSFIDPVLDDRRRINRVRVAVSNPRRQLKPGMFVEAEVQAELPSTAGDPPLQIPASAVLRTGERAIVYRRLSTDDGIRFEGREIILGPRTDEHFIVYSGVEEGDLVVTRGAFKLDSELQIQAKPAMMLEGQAVGEESALEAPITIAGAWKPVLRSLARAEQALNDRQEFQLHLERARALVAGINPDFLTDDYAPLWKEAKMKLTNLFTQSVMESKTTSTEEAWKTLVLELPGRAALAGLSWQLPPLERISEDQVERLQAVLAAYLPITDALAHDQPEEALAEKEKLAQALRHLNGQSEEIAQQVTAATDEDSLQASLRLVTESLSELIAAGAHDQLGELYLVHCPMAFGNEGADWLSRKPVVENPYFGSRMFSCGDVTETLSIPLNLSPEALLDLAHPEKETPSETDHSGH